MGYSRHSVNVTLPKRLNKYHCKLTATGKKLNRASISCVKGFLGNVVMSFRSVNMYLRTHVLSVHLSGFKPQMRGHRTVAECDSDRWA